MPTALSERPFYEEWWFLLVMALVGLILILVLVFTLLLHGHSTKYKACGTGWWLPVISLISMFWFSLQLQPRLKLVPYVEQNRLEPPCSYCSSAPCEGWLTTRSP